MSDLSEMKTWLRESDSTEWIGPYLVKVAEALERLEAELAAANAKIEAARESDRIDLLLALGIESPKPTDNSEDAT